MSISTDGLIIKVNNVGEYDRAVSILTADYGVVRAFCYGARSRKSKSSAATTLLAYSRMVLDRRRDTYVLTEAAANRVFCSRCADLETLTVAQHFCELALALAPQEAPAAEYLKLILNSLSFLESGKRPHLLLKSITELKMLSLSGYTPDLVACRGCAKFEDDAMFFDPVEGSVFCRECKPAGGKLIQISRGVLASMRHIIYSDFSSLYNFTLPENGQKALSDTAEIFLYSQVEHRFSALEFYKNL